MEKLSIEEKAERYDEALSVAQETYTTQPMYREWLAKMFPSLKESEGERMIKFIKQQLFNIKETITENYELDNKLTKAIDWLEKQGEQKSADKIESKFKVGDWVIISTSDGEKVVQIDSIEYFKSDEPRYITSEGRWFGNGTKAHLWTIQDAKDGDVLVTQKTDVTYESIFIFKKIESNRIIQYLHYFTTDADEEVCEARSIDGFLGFVGTTIHPATEEQREQLEKAMADAGYTFDFEKKELKKIDQNPAEGYNITGIGSKHAQGKLGEMIKNLKPVNEILEQSHASWSEEDEKIINNIESYLNCYGNYIVESNEEKAEDVYKSADWLKSLKDKVLPQPKQEWSEEDKKALKVVTDVFEQYGVHLLNYPAFVHWLKTLPSRITFNTYWKPSEEQIEVFEHFVRSIGESGHASPYDNNTKLLYSLLFDLKKLKA